MMRFQWHGFVNPFCAAVYPNVAKVGGLQRQGADGAAVVRYRKPLATQGLKPWEAYLIGGELYPIVAKVGGRRPD